MEAVSFIPSKRGGKLAIYENFIYRLSNAYGEKTYWKCATDDGCEARICLINNHIKSFTGHHIHEPDTRGIENRKFRMKLKERVQKELTTPVPKIYKEELAKRAVDSEIVAALPTYKNVESQLYKFRSEGKRQSSLSTEEIQLRNELSKTEDGRDFLQIDKNINLKGLLNSCSNNDIHQAARDFLTQFIEIYRSHPALWNVKTNDYTNRNLKNAGYDALVNFCRRVDPKANKGIVLKTIRSMWGSFRKELKIMQDSEKSGAVTREQYVPSLWYFDLLTFTCGREIPTEGMDNSADGPSSQMEDTTTTEDCNTGKESIANDNHNNEDDARSENTNISETATACQPEIKKEMDICIESSNTSSLTLASNMREVSEFDALGIIVSKKLAKMEPRQAVYAEALINSILQKGVLQQLTEATDICDGECKLPRITSVSSLPPFKAETYPEGTENANTILP